jgi:hypothetical protein
MGAEFSQENFIRVDPLTKNLAEDPRIDAHDEASREASEASS